MNINKVAKLKDGKTVHIKNVKINDYEINDNYSFVHDWLREVNKYLGQQFKKENELRDKETFYKFLENPENIVIGAFFNDKIIGSARLTTNLKNQKFKHIASFGLAIKASFHNKGLGTILLKKIESIALKKGVKKLEGDYYDGNAQSESLLVKKMNYKEEGRLKYHVFLDEGIFIDTILVGKFIDDKFLSNE